MAGGGIGGEGKTTAAGAADMHTVQTPKGAAGAWTCGGAKPICGEWRRTDPSCRCLHAATAAHRRASTLAARRRGPPVRQQRLGRHHENAVCLVAVQQSREEGADLRPAQVTGRRGRQVGGRDNASCNNRWGWPAHRRHWKLAGGEPRSIVRLSSASGDVHDADATPACKPLIATIGRHVVASARSGLDEDPASACAWPGPPTYLHGLAQPHIVSALMGGNRR